MEAFLFLLLFRKRCMYRIFGAHVDTFSTADTFRAVRSLVDFYIHVAFFLAEPAFCTFFFIDFIPVERETVEESVNRTERAEVFAEWAVGLDGKDYDEK